MTKASILKIARAAYPAHEFQLRVDPQRGSIEQARQDSEARQREFEAINIELHRIGRTDKGLIDAARFAVDVNGDEPSMSQLREATELAEQRRDLIERKRQIESQRGQFRPRIELLYRRKGDYGWRSFWADDWESLSTQILNRKETA